MSYTNKMSVETRNIQNAKFIAIRIPLLKEIHNNNMWKLTYQKAITRRISLFIDIEYEQILIMRRYQNQIEDYNHF